MIPIAARGETEPGLSITSGAIPNSEEEAPATPPRLWCSLAGGRREPSPCIHPSLVDFTATVPAIRGRNPTAPAPRFELALRQIPQDAEHARAAFGIVVAPLLRGDLARTDAPEAVALEESCDALARGAREYARMAALARHLAQRRHDVPADPLPEEPGQGVERCDLTRARLRVRHER